MIDRQQQRAKPRTSRSKNYGMAPTGKQRDIAPGSCGSPGRFSVNWQFIYTEEEVGRHFLDNYAYFELIGPIGHFQSDQCCAFIGYWGPGLFYPAHHHASEELYFVLAGYALFVSDGDGPATLGPAAHRFHASHQSHAMTTTDSAILTLVLWRGPDLIGLSQLVKTHR